MTAMSRHVKTKCDAIMVLKQFLFNNVLVRLVGIHPETGIAFYVNDGHGGVIGVQVHPNGTKKQINAGKNNDGYSYVHGKAEYLQFKHAFGSQKAILASHAVYLAWIGPIEPGMTIDHINGCTTDNRYENLRCVSGAINSRDGGFLRKLKKAGFDPLRIQRAYLLRFFDRMALLKPAIPQRKYSKLTRTQLRRILFAPEFNSNFKF